MSNTFDDEQAKADMVERRNRAARVGSSLRWLHRPKYDVTCKVCTATPEVHDLLKAGYLQKIKLRVLGQPYGMTQYDIARHAKWANWKWDRAKNTEEKLATILEKGDSRIKSGEIEIDGKLYFGVLQHVDKREGKIADLSRGDGNVTINIDLSGVPIPQPARGLGTAQYGQLKQEMRAIGPTAVTLVEDTTVQLEPAFAEDAPYEKTPVVDCSPSNEVVPEGGSPRTG